MKEEKFDKLKSFENSLMNRSQSNNPDIAEGVIKLKDRSSQSCIDASLVSGKIQNE